MKVLPGATDGAYRLSNDKTSFMSIINPLRFTLHNQKLLVRSWLLVLIPLVFLHCSKGHKQNVDNSAANIINQLVPNQSGDCGTCPPYIDQYDWNGRTIYFYSCIGITCKCAPQLYEMKGDKIPYDTATYGAFNREAKYIRNTWRCRN